jgi:hypothetical protein
MAQRVRGIMGSGVGIGGPAIERSSAAALAGACDEPRNR